MQKFMIFIVLIVGISMSMVAVKIAKSGDLVIFGEAKNNEGGIVADRIVIRDSREKIVACPVEEVYRGKLKNIKIRKKPREEKIEKMLNLAKQKNNLNQLNR